MAAPQDRRRLALIGGVGAGLVALLLVARLLSGGGGGGGTADTTFVPELPVVTTTTTTVPAPEIPGGSFDVFATKDPFAPVIQIDTGGGGDAGATGATGASGATGSSGGGSVTPSAGTAVAVVDVLDQNGTTVAQVRVGSTVYTVTAGQSFATSYMVVGISGQCVQLLYGDAPFQLCKGEEVIK